MKIKAFFTLILLSSTSGLVQSASALERTISIPVEMSQLLNTPSFVQAVNQANETAKKKGVSLSYESLEVGLPSLAPGHSVTELRMSGYRRTGFMNATPVGIGKILITYIYSADAELIESVEFQTAGE